MNAYQQRQHDEEQRLIQALKDSGRQVFRGELGNSMVVVTKRPNGIRQQTVWLGRAGTLDRFKEILAA